MLARRTLQLDRLRAVLARLRFPARLLTQTFSTPCWSLSLSANKRIREYLSPAHRPPEQRSQPIFLGLWPGLQLPNTLGPRAHGPRWPPRTPAGAAQNKSPTNAALWLGLSQFAALCWVFRL